ncbi:MAG: hypothetical protein RIC14_05580 [Filomicrobium sp.]
MPVTLVGVASGINGALSIPTHSAGDLIVVCISSKRSDSHSTQPSDIAAPSGWTELLRSNQGNFNQLVVGYKVAASSSEASPSWGSHQLAYGVLVYSGAEIGASDIVSASSSTIDWPALSLDKTDGSSWVLTAASTSHDAGAETPPSGSVERIDAGNHKFLGAHDTDGGEASWSGKTTTLSRSTSIGGASIEIKEVGGSASDDLEAVELAVSASAEAVGLGQSHALDLSSTAIECSVDDASLSQRHTLHPLHLGSETSASPAVVAQAHNLTPVDLETSASSESATLSQGHAVGAANLSTSTALGDPALGVRSNLVAERVIARPHVSQTSFAQSHALGSMSLAAGADVSDAQLGGTSELTAEGITASPVTHASEVGQEHSFSGQDATSTASLERAGLTQTHNLTSQDLRSEATLVGTNLSINGQLNLSANSIASTIVVSPTTATQVVRKRLAFTVSAPGRHTATVAAPQQAAQYARQQVEIGTSTLRAGSRSIQYAVTRHA